MLSSKKTKGTAVVTQSKHFDVYRALIGFGISICIILLSIMLSNAIKNSNDLSTVIANQVAAKDTLQKLEQRGEYNNREYINHTRDGHPSSTINLFKVMEKRFDDMMKKHENR
jgi:hypothetical protein